MAYQVATTVVTLNDLEGHSSVAGLFKCNPSNIYTAYYTISTDSVLARFLCISRGSCFCSFVLSRNAGLDKTVQSQIYWGLLKTVLTCRQFSSHWLHTSDTDMTILSKTVFVLSVSAVWTKHKSCVPCYSGFNWTITCPCIAKVANYKCCVNVSDLLSSPHFCKVIH